MPTNGPAPSGPKPPASPAPPPANRKAFRPLPNDPRLGDHMTRLGEPERPGDTVMGFGWGLIAVAVLIALVILTSRG